MAKSTFARYVNGSKNDDDDDPKKKNKGGGGTGPWGLVDFNGDRPGNGKGKGGGKLGPHTGGGDKGDDRNKNKPGHQGLRNKGLSDELKQNLKNVMDAYLQQDKTLLEGYASRVGQLDVSVKDNEKTASGQGFAAMSNRGRERANAMSEIIAQGGGESDALRAQGMSLRNWSQNQGEVNRSFHETLTSVNSSLTDLNSDTKSARVQVAQQMIADKGQLWNNYFNDKSEALTQLGNTYGQMAEQYGLADEQVGSKKRKKMQNRLQNKSGRAFMQAARVGSQSWDAPDVDDEVTNWQGRAAYEGQLNNNNLGSMAAGPAMDKPEGAGLRKWNA